MLNPSTLCGDLSVASRKRKLAQTEMSLQQISAQISVYSHKTLNLYDNQHAIHLHFVVFEQMHDFTASLIEQTLHKLNRRHIGSHA